MKKTFTFLGLVMSLLLLMTIAAGSLQAQNIVGGNNGDPSAILDLQSSEKGLLIPRMTSTERSAIASPAAGLMIYNTTLSCLEVNIGSSSSPDWLCLAGAGKVASIDCSGAVQAGNLIAEAAASGVSVTLTYTGGNGNNYSMQSVTSTGVTGLTASLNAGTLVSGSGSLIYTISGTPSAAGTASFALIVGGQTCSLGLSVAPPVGVITALDCADATLTGSLAASAAASDVSVSVPYSGGNGGTYSAQTINSTGVTGLTATLAASTLADGNGSLEYSITGTPAAVGTANFALSIGGQSCTLSVSVAPPAGVITALNCAGATITGTLTASEEASGVSVSVPYTGANGGTYAAQMVNSTGSTGLTATLAAGILASGSGSLQYAISGTPATAGTAAFALSIGGQSCTLNLSVAQPAAMVTTLDCAGATSTGTLTAGVAASGVSSSVPYTGGNGGTFALQTVSSTGVTGLTATRSAGSLVSGSGSVVYTITGTPSAGGTANFVINLGGQSCTLSRTVAIPIGTITALNCASATASGCLDDVIHEDVFHGRL